MIMWIERLTVYVYIKYVLEFLLHSLLYIYIYTYIRLKISVEKLNLKNK